MPTPPPLATGSARVAPPARGDDLAVRDAYGWQDLDLEHAFHEVETLPDNDRVRYTISLAARREAWAPPRGEPSACIPTGDDSMEIQIQENPGKLYLARGSEPLSGGKVMMSKWAADLESYKSAVEEHLSDNVARDYARFFKASFRKMPSGIRVAGHQRIGEHLHCFPVDGIEPQTGAGHPNHPIDHYRESFLYLAHGDDEVVVRIDRFRKETATACWGLAQALSASSAPTCSRPDLHAQLPRQNGRPSDTG